MTSETILHARLPYFMKVVNKSSGLVWRDFYAPVPPVISVGLPTLQFAILAVYARSEICGGPLLTNQTPVN